MSVSLSVCSFLFTPKTANHNEVDIWRMNTPLDADDLRLIKTGFGQPLAGNLPCNVYFHFSSVVGEDAFKNHHYFVVAQPLVPYSSVIYSRMYL